MLESGTAVKRGLIILAAAALFTLGLGIVLYVTVIRDRLTPRQPTLTVIEMTATALPVAPSTPPTPVPVSSPDPSATPEPSADVVGVVKEYQAGALIIVLEPIAGDIEQVIVPENLTVTWADGSRASPREIAIGQTIQAAGDLDALGRLIASRIVITQEAAPSSTPSPAPTATPEPSKTPWMGWLGEFYDNPNLNGQPIVARTDQSIDFMWGEGAPLAGVPADGFSVRWRGAWQFEEGGYRFYAFTDDGVRVLVDGELIIDQWHDQSPTLSYADRYMTAGAHDVTIEYYDGQHNAQIRMWWDFQGAYPNWRGEYFGNVDLAGDPVLLRNDADVAFDWDGFAPGENVPEDNFSIRWTRTIAFDEGAYEFLAVADDGVRVWLDGIPLIDEWHENDNQTHTAPIWIEQGEHEVRIEYLELGGDAKVRVWWNRQTEFEQWRGAYYANPDLDGRPAWVREDEAISFDWGEAGPGHNLPNDNFSISWTRTLALEDGVYRFWCYADDGVRMLLDDQLIIDQWRDSPAEDLELFLTVPAGEHELRVDYYERGDQAVVRAGWDKVGTPTPTTEPTVAATSTLTPTATVEVTMTLEPTAEPTPTVEPTSTPTLFAPTREPVISPTPTSEPPTTTPVPLTPTQEPPTATMEPATTEPTPVTAEPTAGAAATPTVKPTTSPTPTEEGYPPPKVV